MQIFNPASRIVRLVRGHFPLLIVLSVVVFPIVSPALVLEDGDILISNGRLAKVLDGAPPTLVAGLYPQEIEVDSLGRLVFSAADFDSSSGLTLFRVDPANGNREILAREFFVVDMVLLDDATLLVAGRQFGDPFGIYQVTIPEGVVTPVSTGGLLTSPSEMAFDPSTGSIVVRSSAGVSRVNLDTGAQTPITFTSLPSVGAVAVTPSGEIFIWSDTGADFNSFFSRVDQVTGSLVTIASFQDIREMVADDSGTIWATIQFGSIFSRMRALVSIDPVTGQFAEAAPAILGDFCVGSDGLVRLAGFSPTGLSSEVEGQSAVELIDPVAGTSVPILFGALGLNVDVRGAVIRQNADDSSSLIVFTNFSGILEVDPVTGDSTRLVPFGGLIGNQNLRPNPFLGRDGRIFFVNTQQSFVLALEPDNTLSFVSGGNLVDQPSAVIDRPDGSLLVGNMGFTHPGVARIDTDGIQTSVLVEEFGFGFGRVFDLVPGVASDAVIRGSIGTGVVRLDAATGMTSDIPVAASAFPILFLGSGPNGQPLVGSYYSLFELDESDGSVAEFSDDLPSDSVHAFVPEPGVGSALMTGLLGLSVLARQRTAELNEPF